INPVDGVFAALLAPSNIPNRKRWQFIWKTDEGKVAALSLLRDNDGWVDMEEKDTRYNTAEARFQLLPDQVFGLSHQGKAFELIGRPSAILYRAQEESTSITGRKERMISPQRLLLTSRVKPQGGGNNELITIDFSLSHEGIPQIPTEVEINPVDFARTALNLNGETDLVKLPAKVKAFNKTFTMSMWVRHSSGDGTLIRRGLDPAKKDDTGVAIAWRPEDDQLEARIKTADEDITISVPQPTSHTWHHIGLILDANGYLTLWIDGQPAATSDKKIAKFKAAGELIIGGPGDKAAPGNWLDFDIDQIVLWSDAREQELTAERIYNELTDEALKEKALLGCWMMDDAHGGPINQSQDSSSYNNPAEVIGADHINQTAPIFRAGNQAFESSLGGLSVGMGLIRFDKTFWVDDPTLFLSADGVVHLYITKNSEKDKTDGELMVLPYDTTCARSQFNFKWESEVGSPSNSESGDLILSAKTTGPIMNRAELKLKREDTGYTLTIKHERLELTEVWKNLPKKIEDLILILNGQAQTEYPDPEKNPTKKIFYDYLNNTEFAIKGINDGKKASLPEALLHEDKNLSIASPSFAAGMSHVPQNGGNPEIQFDGRRVTADATMRQQGNFGGWVHDPVAVSGKFGYFDGKTVTATVDLTADKLDILNNPKDFTLEAWVRPDQPATDSLSSSRIFNLNGNQSELRYAMGLTPGGALNLQHDRSVTTFQKKPPLLTSDDRTVEIGKGDNQKELRFNESFTIGLRMTAPTGSNAAGSLFQLLSPGNNMFYAEVDENGIWFKFIDIANSSGHLSQSRGVYAPFGVSPGEPVFVACVWDIARESGKVLQKESNEEDDQRKNRDGTMSIFINGSKEGEVKAEWCGYHDISLLNLGKPGTDGEFKDTQNWIKELQEKGFLKKKKDDPNFTVVPGENYSKGCQT
ncbi:MAG: LamG-like jellyroll fold domain-containing protein, partial [Chloroflexota bacterium]